MGEGQMDSAGENRQRNISENASRGLQTMVLLCVLAAVFCQFECEERVEGGKGGPPESIYFPAYLI